MEMKFIPVVQWWECWRCSEKCSNPIEGVEDAWREYETRKMYLPTVELKD